MLLFITIAMIFFLVSDPAIGLGLDSRVIMGMNCGAGNGLWYLLLPPLVVGFDSHLCVVFLHLVGVWIRIICLLAGGELALPLLTLSNSK